MLRLKRQLMWLTSVLIVVLVLTLIILSALLGPGELTTELVFLVCGSLVFFGITAILINVVGTQLLRTGDHFLHRWELQRLKGRSSFVKQFVVKNSIVILAPLGVVFLGIGITRGAGFLVPGYVILAVFTIGGLYWIGSELWRNRESEYEKKRQSSGIGPA